MVLDELVGFLVEDNDIETASLAGGGGTMSLPHRVKTANLSDGGGTMSRPHHTSGSISLHAWLSPDTAPCSACGLSPSKSLAWCLSLYR